MTPNAIAEHFETSRQAVWKHIKVLTECDLLRQENVGREIYYYFNPKKMKEVEDFILPFKQMREKQYNQLDQVLTTTRPKKNGK